MTAPFSFPLSSPFGSGFSFVSGLVGSPTASLHPTPAGELAGGLDQLLDPVTLNYKRTDDGEWAQTADGRTAVLIAFSVELGKSPFDPTHGTIFAELLRRGDPLDHETLHAETVRVGADLENEGVLEGFDVLTEDEAGRPLVEGGRAVVRTKWRDLSSGSPINEVFSPR